MDNIFFYFAINNIIINNIIYCTIYWNHNILFPCPDKDSWTQEHYCMQYIQIFWGESKVQHGWQSGVDLRGLIKKSIFD